MLIIIMAAVFLVGAVVVWFSFMGIHRSLESYGKKARLAARLTKEAVQRQGEAQSRADTAEKRAAAAERSVLDMERRAQDATHRQEDAERNIQDLDRRRAEAERTLQSAERRVEDVRHQVKDVERDLDTKRRNLAEAEEELRRKKREASEEVAAWTQAETARLTQRLNDQYSSELAGMKKELADKLQSETEKIQAYFLEFAKSKTSLAGEDIQGFVDAQLTEIQKKL